MLTGVTRVVEGAGAGQGIVGRHAHDRDRSRLRAQPRAQARVRGGAAVEQRYALECAAVRQRQARSDGRTATEGEGLEPCVGAEALRGVAQPFAGSRVGLGARAMHPEGIPGGDGRGDAITGPKLAICHGAQATCRQQGQQGSAAQELTPGTHG